MGPRDPSSSSYDKHRLDRPERIYDLVVQWRVDVNLEVGQEKGAK
jgi:hypothetical protein